MLDTYELSIREMSVKFSVTLRALRFYESKGLLSPMRSGAARFYSQKDQARLHLILKGKRLGFTLSEVAELMASASRANSQGLSLSNAQIEAQIASLSRRREDVEKSLQELRVGLEHRKA